MRIRVIAAAAAVALAAAPAFVAGPAQAQTKVAEALYRQAQQSGPSEGASGGSGSADAPIDGEVIDAEVVDEK